MIHKILKKIYKFLFIKKLNENEKFEINLNNNKLIESFEKQEEKYIANCNNKKIVIRNFHHSDYAVFKQIFNLV